MDTIEIEQYLLGALLHNNVPVQLGEHDFIEPEHYRLFTEIQSGKRVIDYSGTIDEEYIRILVDSTVTYWDFTIEEYVKIIRKNSSKRKIHQAATVALSMLDDKDPNEVLSVLQAAIEENTVSSIKNAEQLLDEIVNDITLPKKCYPTGLKLLDEATGGGLYEGFTYGFCGMEKSGKTTLAHTISYQLDTPHLYVAMEMGSKQIEQRNVARKLNKNSLDFLRGKITTDQLKALPASNPNRYYIDMIGSTLPDILNQVRAAKLKHKITGFILDYWQLIEPPRNTGTEEQGLRKIAQDVANFARKEKLWCIILAQMNQDGKLFGGNGIKKACDQLYMIRTPDHSEFTRWLEMDVSRYTLKENIGSNERPYLMLNTSEGPFFHE